MHLHVSRERERERERERADLLAVVGVGARHLLFDRVDLRRQETAQAENVALALRERHSCSAKCSATMLVQRSRHLH